MNRADYLGVVNDMHLSNGLPWSIPITLSVSSGQAARLKEGAQAALVNAQGSLQAIMTIDEKVAKVLSEGMHPMPKGANL